MKYCFCHILHFHIYWSLFLDTLLFSIVYSSSNAMLILLQWLYGTFLLSVRQKSFIMLFPIFLDYSWAFFLPHNFWGHLIQFLKISPYWNSNLNYIKFIEKIWENWHFMAYNFPMQEHGIACSFPDLIFKSSRRFNPIYVSILYFIHFHKQYTYYFVFKIPTLLSLTKTLCALYPSIQCNCCIVFDAKNETTYPEPWRCAFSLHPKFLFFFILQTVPH